MHLTDPAPEAVELTIAEALAAAVKLHRAGRIQDAEALYQRVLEVDPLQPDALQFLGIVSMHKGENEKAVELIRKSIEIDPGSADRHNNLGNVLLFDERADEAVEAYKTAIALAPDHADAHNNLGIIYRAQRRFEESARAYERAIEINPRHVEAYTNYGNLLAAAGRLREAISAYAKALTLRPYDPDARKFIAGAHAFLGDLDAAAAIYREWLAQEPDHVGVRHLLAACTGENVPERATDAYVESTFDSFARSFDSRLAHLEYRAPELVAEALRCVCAAPQRRLVALDAGCGTGLCGPLMAPYVSRLDGVDLSGGMLQRARERAVYDNLVKSELTQYLQDSESVYDVIVSADTFVYFGDLSAAMHAASRALRPGGHLIFTVEALSQPEVPEGHRLNFHGRYSHSREYVERTVRDAGFAEVKIEDGVLRMERGEPVAGLVVTARSERQVA